MVFQPEARFRQLCHCNFRENVVKLLYIPVLDSEPVFLIVNKYGKIGLYNSRTFAMAHTYVLDLSVPMHPYMDKVLMHIARYKKLDHPQPKCQQTHLVVDAVYCPDFKACLFLTSKGILQCYDIGEIETQSIGLELLPRKEFMGLKHGRPVMPIRNLGHVETHRLYGLREFPTCMFYSPALDGEVKAKKANEHTRPQLLIGDSEGCVTIIRVDSKSTGNLFGHRKIRGTRHELIAIDLFNEGLLKVYKGHHGPVKQLLLLRLRQLVVSCCATDRKYSLFVNDLLVTRTKPYVISCRKGINAFAHSNVLKLMATGSNDFVIRLFNDFVTQMPQMELTGHKAPILAVEFVHISFLKAQTLLSYSKDVELRAWDPINYVCLQSIYVSFPPKSALTCKTPEFPQNCLYVHQPHYTHTDAGQGGGMKFGFANPNPELIPADSDDGKQPREECKPESETLANAKGVFERDSTKDGDIILFYCNSYTKIYIEKDTSGWPFDFDDFIDEFEEATVKMQQKLLHRQHSVSKNPKTYYHSRIALTKEEISTLESNLDGTTRDILGIKKYVDLKLGIQRMYAFPGEEIDLAADSPSGEGDAASVPQEAGNQDREVSISAMSLSTRALKRHHSLERSKRHPAKLDFITQGIAFKTMPLYDLEPLAFQCLKQEPKLPAQAPDGRDKPSTSASATAAAGMPVTDTMRAFGLTSILTVEDLVTPEVQQFFSAENMQKVQKSLELTEQTLRNQIAGLTLDMDYDEELAELGLGPRTEPEAEPQEKRQEPGQSRSRPASASSSNATTISSFSSKLIEESNPTLIELGQQTFTSRPEMAEIGGNYGGEDLALSLVSRSPTISESDSARYEDTDYGADDDCDGGRRSCSEVPDLVSDVNADNGLLVPAEAEIPFESS